MPRFLLSVHKTDDAPTFHAAVNIGRDLLAGIAVRRQVFAEAAAHVVAGGLWEMYYWSYSTSFYEDLDVEERLGEQMSSDVEEHDLVVITKRQMVKLPEPCLIECSQMIVRAEEVAFFAYQKHTDVHLMTTAIPYSLILKE